MLRRCGRCKREKPTRDFAWRRKSKGQRDNYCRTCRAEYKQEHYAKNRQRYIDNATARNRRVTEERMRYLVNFLRDHPCMDCGETDVVVLEFDHRGNKEFEIGNGLRSKNWDDVLSEMTKCDVVCANCHRRRTARRGAFARATFTAREASRLFM